MKIPLGLGSYESKSIPFSAQRCVNLYADIAQDEGLSEFILQGTPGVVSFAALGSGVSRGAIVMGGVYYVVSGNTLYSVDSLGVGTNRGTIAGAKRVSMAHNGDKLCLVVPGGNSYVYVASTTTLTPITDVDFLASDTVCFKDGYYVFTQTAGNVFFISALNDPLSFDALDRGTAEQSPGNIIGCHANYDEVVVFKEDNTEIFQNVGGSGFPFQRIPGASLEKGSHCKYSPIQWGGSFFFLGGGINEKTSFFEARAGGEPAQISTDAISNEIQKFTREEIAEAFTFSYSIGGINFVGITIRSSNINSRTFVYNVTASILAKRPVWFEQQSGVTENAWRSESIDFVYNKLLISDNVDGRVGYLDVDTYDEYGNAILREKTLPPVYFGNSGVYFSKLELFIDSGRGLIIGQGSDPQIMMEFSDDGARTWSSEFWRKMGAIGEYNRRSVWRRLGRADRSRVFRFSVSDPIQTTLIKCEVTISGGK